MIQLQHLKIENFLSFRKVELTLNDRGLVFIVGKNYDSDCFDSNGSGKSSLFESIVYCLFGVTVRGIKADDVINNKVKENCKVSLSFSNFSLFAPKSSVKKSETLAPAPHKFF